MGDGSIEILANAKALAIPCLRCRAGRLRPRGRRPERRQATAAGYEAVRAWSICRW